MSSKHTDNLVRLNGRTFLPEEVASLAIALAMEKKAFRPVLLDLRSQGAFTEYFALVSASNGRQVGAVAEGIRMFFKQTFGINPIAVDGMESLTWVLIDYGFLFIHVFQEPTRELYQLEQLWSKGRVVALNEGEVQSLFDDVKGMAKINADAAAAAAQY